MKMHLATWHRPCSFTVEFGTGFDWIRMSLAEKDLSISEDHHTEADSYISIFCHALSWYVKGLCVFTRTSASDKFDLLSELSYERWVRCFLLVEIFPAIEFWFLPDVVVAYRSEVSHHTGEYLAWSPVDLQSFFVVECLHGDDFCYKDKRGFILWFFSPWWSWASPDLMCVSVWYPHWIHLLRIRVHDRISDSNRVLLLHIRVSDR